MVGGHNMKNYIKRRSTGHYLLFSVCSRHLPPPLFFCATSVFLSPLLLSSTNQINLLHACTLGGTFVRVHLHVKWTPALFLNLSPLYLLRQVFH